SPCTTPSGLRSTSSEYCPAELRWQMPRQEAPSRSSVSTLAPSRAHSAEYMPSPRVEAGGARRVVSKSLAQATMQSPAQALPSSGRSTARRRLWVAPSPAPRAGLDFEVRGLLASWESCERVAMVV